MRFRVFLLIFTIVFWIFMAIEPLSRYDWAMENILFVAFFAVLLLTYKKFQFSDVSYFLMAIFFVIHLTGAHYTYSKVPFGFYLSDVFNFSRNHFDRIGHFAFGLLFFYPIRELLLKYNKLGNFARIYLPIDIILALSAFFEIIEWLFTLQVSQQLKDDYLGMQGDIWDAQKDMALAVLGGLVTTVFLWCKGRFCKSV